MANENAILYKIITDVTGDENFFSDFKDSYAKRVIGQKIVYLFQEYLRIKTPWLFTWYVGGPYSPGLTVELYAIADNSHEAAQRARSINFNDRTQATIARIRDLVTNRRDRPAAANWLELLTSTHYVAKWRGLNFSSPSLVEQVRQAKPKFDRDEIADSIRTLRDFLNAS